MSYSVYDVSIPVLVRGLTILSALLDKGAAHAQQHNIDPVFLPNARLAPDMLTLAGQVQRASDTAKFAAARLSGIEAPSFADEEATFEQLKDRCAKTITYLQSVERTALEAGETRQITFWRFERVDAHRRSIPATIRVAQLLLSPHDRLRHLASQRRAGRQARLSRIVREPRVTPGFACCRKNKPRGHDEGPVGEFG